MRAWPAFKNLMQFHLFQYIMHTLLISVVNLSAGGARVRSIIVKDISIMRWLLSQMFEQQNIELKCMLRSNYYYMHCKSVVDKAYQWNGAVCQQPVKCNCSLNNDIMATRSSITVTGQIWRCSHGIINKLLHEAKSMPSSNLEIFRLSHTDEKISNDWRCVHK